MKLLSRYPSEVVVVGVVVVVWVICGVTVTGFWSTAGLSDVLGRAVTAGILVVGLTLCMLAAEIDLSVGATMALAGVVYASVEPTHGLWAGAVVGLLAGAGVGVANAVMVCALGVNSFIGTLGSLFVAQSLALVISHGRPLATTNVDAAISLTDPLFGPVSPRVLLFAACVVAAQCFVTFARHGRDLIAVGGNANAARDSGIPVQRRRATAFVLSGLLAGVAGVQLTIGLVSAAPTAGNVELLLAVAAAFLGGVSLSGGRGSILAAGLAVVALSGVSAALELAQVDRTYSQVIVGAVILVAGALAGRSWLAPQGRLR